MHTNNGTPFAFATNTGATSTEDVWYDVCIMHSAGDIEVWRRERGSGDEMTTIFNEYTMFAAMQTNHWWIWMETTTAGDYEFDDFSRVSNLGAYDPHKDLFTYNDANELVSGGGCDYYYDDWGRLISKEDGTHEAAYGYAYGHKLWAVESDFPGEDDVQYWYTGDGRRYSRECGSDKSYYFFDEGYNLVNEANGSGVLQRSYVTGNRAQFTSMASYTYFLHDHLGNARRLLDGWKDTVAAYDYTPYGLVYGHAGDLGATTHLYTGHDWDAQAGLYYAPYRYYNPFTARWMTRDPLEMVDGPNVYAYVACRPVLFIDLLGKELTDISSSKWVKKCKRLLNECQDDEKVKGGLDRAGDRISYDEIRSPALSRPP